MTNIQNKKANANEIKLTRSCGESFEMVVVKLTGYIFISSVDTYDSVGEGILIKDDEWTVEGIKKHIKEIAYFNNEHRYDDNHTRYTDDEYDSIAKLFFQSVDFE